MSAIFSDHQLDNIADHLSATGYLVVSDIIDDKLLVQLQDQAKSLPQAQWKTAGIGRSSDHQINQSIRSDKIHWLEGSTRAESLFLTLMDNLRLGLNRRLYLGLYDFESHFSIYQPGMFYKTHIDALKGKSNRVLSTVLYLNSDWVSQDGGELLLYSESQQTTLATVMPNMGHMVIFLSEKFPHQVLAAHRERYSIAGWFRVNNNQAGFIDPAH